nr:MAG TPA: hypothetical protein [Caudoviricetes sp.]
MPLKGVKNEHRCIRVAGHGCDRRDRRNISGACVVCR